jgi:uncharacterized protein YkwD
MLTLFFALIVGQAAPDATVKWRDLSNMPGWQGYGPILQSGWVDTTKFRRIDNPGVEYPAAGREKDFVLSAGAKSSTDVAVTQVAQAQPGQQPAQEVQVAQPVQYTGDPYGFLGWLNATRASYGLPAVGYDPNLSGWAAMNNDQQAARGMGHFVMGPARRQNAAIGAFANIGAMWMNSPGHRAALLDPSIRWMGIAGLGAYWTFNAN